MLQRTAKSCGPDAPTLASSSRMLCRPNRVRTQRKFANDGGKRARSPGRVRRKPLKPLRAGMPGDSGVLVVTRVRSTNPSAHETAGAAGTRHSPRPLWAENSSTPRAPRAARTKSYANLHQRHCEEQRDEAIHPFFTPRDGFFAALAMTVLTARAGARSMTGSAKRSGVGAAKCHFHPCTTDFAIMQ